MTKNKRQKESKKAKFSCSINEKLLNKLDEFLEENEILKRSRYIESLIRQDLKDRGFEIKRDF